MQITEKYTFFWKDKIAQWNMTPFKDHNGIIYNCAEQYMMARKAALFNDTESYIKIMISKDPADQQALGRTIKNFNQYIWDQNKEDIVFNGNFLKFTQNRHLLNVLMGTGNTILVEASEFDTIWGVGLAADNPDILHQHKWKGLNLLGITLMRVRAQLKGAYEMLLKEEMKK